MKRVVFLTGTRADFGKIKSLIETLHENDGFEVFIFATGMHMNPQFGRTVNEVYKTLKSEIFSFYNHRDGDTMDVILSKTIQGFSDYIHDIKPDMIVVHGDRVEALAGAIVGMMNNINVSHIEGGELSGTVDDSIRHAVSKLSHFHFVSNLEAKKRLLQLGEDKDRVFVIGSPDLDIMTSEKLPTLNDVKVKYDIGFDNYGVVMFHPVVTEFEQMPKFSKQFVDSIEDSDENFVIILPNNDKGYEFIIKEYSRLERFKNIKIFPSIRFEYFLTLLKNAQFILGNSSAGIREAPFYGVPCINVGTRQNGRSSDKGIINCSYEKDEILVSLEKSKSLETEETKEFGLGDSAKQFLDVLVSNDLWNFEKQKVFKDIQYEN